MDEAGDNSLLALTISYMLTPVMRALPMMKAAVSKKELALLGASQGKNQGSASGGVANLPILTSSHRPGNFFRNSVPTRLRAKCT